MIFWQLPHNLSQKLLHSAQNCLASVFISSKHALCKNSSCSHGGESCKEITAGSNVSMIQHVESFPLRNQQKKSTALTAQKKSLSCLHYRFWNHWSLSDWACLPLQISANLPLVYFHLGQFKKRERLVKCCKTIALHLYQLRKNSRKNISGWIN